ncbi:hypothetical protein [Streptomyces sp. NPDC051183]|uniref:hypothetical protein n=1 Tax=Streptomyces sp. NPDC051183 TaxID=3155165 RepID=UPI003446C162
MERGRTRGPQRRTVQALAAALGLGEDGARDLEHAASLGRPRAAAAVVRPPAATPACWCAGCRRTGCCCVTWCA